MGGTGYLSAHDDVYRLEDPELYLTGTSEVALAGYHMDEILDLSNGPIRYAAAGSSRKSRTAGTSAASGGSSAAIISLTPPAARTGRRPAARSAGAVKRSHRKRARRSTAWSGWA